MPSNYSAKELRRMDAKRRKRMRRSLRVSAYRLGVGIVDGIARGILSTSIAVDSKGRILWGSIGPKEKP